VTQQDIRLRSEPTPSNERSARIRESRARSQQERAATLAAYRERLTHELHIDGSAAQEWLVDSAVSAALEISVVTTLFVRGYARPADMERLQGARSQLQRTLRALGALPGAATADDGPPANATSEEKRAWSRQYVERALAEGRTAE
jgi:hypothetical protein